MSYEINFFGFPGPLFNLIESGNKIAYPKNTAIEWLEMLVLLKDLGLNIAIFPPHDRPHLSTLKFLGFTGSESVIIAKSIAESIDLFSACTSSGFIWCGNAATVTPSTDSSDSKIHITPANLSGNFARSLETLFTTKVLKIIFPDKVNFMIHEPLPRGDFFEDEGSTNHFNFYDHLGGVGVHLLGFSRYAFKKNAIEPRRYRSLQTYEAQFSKIRKHQLYEDRTLITQESAIAIDAGGLHINKVALGDKNFLMYHEKAFVSTDTIIDELKMRVETSCHTNLVTIQVPEKKVSLEDSINSSLFESLYVVNKNKIGYLVCPEACKHIPSISDFLTEVREAKGNPITDIHYVNVSGTLQSKGGPASLCFKVSGTNEQIKSIKESVLFTDRLLERLNECIKKNYREEIKFEDLKDPKLLDQNRKALDEISKILDLGSIYDFQK